MKHKPYRQILFLGMLSLTALLSCSMALAQESDRNNYMSLAQGTVPVAIDAGDELRVGMEQALQAIDGDHRGFVLTPRPGGANAEVVLVYELPAMTTFDSFAIPNILETPSPSQTFVRSVLIAGSVTGGDGPYTALAEMELATHSQAGEVTEIPVSIDMPVRWVRVSLAGGIHIERDKTFFEFSEIAGYGRQEQVPLSQAFSGKWKGRGVKMELKQDGVRVSGCYDSDGRLNGTVSGNLLHATGKTDRGGIPSTFVLSIGGDKQIVGVRSTNGAPFKLYTGDVSATLKTDCSTRPVERIGCGSIIHGIQFDYDSATLRPESDAHLDALYDGLANSTAATITVIGHTSSEGAAAYNDKLSQRRAEAVAGAIVARGIKPGRITAQGLGESSPIADNETEVGRSLNRRVEIECR